ncbi:MAG: hypothetical protein U0521_02090 [Anaerolineae bacterium]
MSGSQSQAHIYIDTNRVVSPISPLLFSGFAEHMGRAIYDGIYYPESGFAARRRKRGLRTDVLAALRELNFRAMRQFRRQLPERLPLAGRSRSQRSAPAPPRPRLAVD